MICSCNSQASKEKPMDLEMLLLEENLGTKYDEKNVKEEIETNGDVSCMLGKTGLGENKPEKSKIKTGILKWMISKSTDQGSEVFVVSRRSHVKRQIV